jgi:ComF family protein
MSTVTGSPTSRRHQVFKFCLDVVFPPVCIRCRKIGSLLCRSCLRQLVPAGDRICFRCGRQWEQAVFPAAAATCSTCREEPSPLQQMRAPLMYIEPASEIVHRFKFDGYFALAGPLAAIMADRWPNWETPPDLILPIPLHPKRLRRRGYNQSALLARSLAAVRGIGYQEDALARIRHTVPQVGLGPVERAENVKNAFAIKRDLIDGRNILLIDDVLTTGATMRSAAETLLGGGVASVSAYCLARVT